MRLAVIAPAVALLAAAPASAQETTTFSYDALGRLTLASHAGAVNAGVSQQYNLDLAGNRQLVTVAGVPTQGSSNVIVIPLGAQLNVITIGN